jgi:hypothetical protein
MASKGTAFFDRMGNYYPTLEAATCADLERLLGKLGEGEGKSLAPGLARLMFENREQIQSIFQEHNDPPERAVLPLKKEEKP